VFVEVTNSVRFAGLILAGGEGKRFGGPKAFAKLDDGRTFLEACLGTLREAGAAPIVATLPPGTGDPGYDSLVAVVLPTTGLDMFASIKAGLDRLMHYPEWGKTALLPVDHPLVTADVVTTLVSTKASAVIPSFRGKHGHPVCLDRDVAVGIVESRHPGPTLREVLREVGAVNVEVDDPGVIANCNTPDALRDSLRAEKGS
jgi:CTP:molybdopterin cytidylyltransferase MocA